MPSWFIWGIMLAFMLCMTQSDPARMITTTTT